MKVVHDPLRDMSRPDEPYERQKSEDFKAATYRCSLPAAYHWPPHVTFHENPSLLISHSTKGASTQPPASSSKSHSSSSPAVSSGLSSGNAHSPSQYNPANAPSGNALCVSQVLGNQLMVCGPEYCPPPNLPPIEVLSQQFTHDELAAATNYFDPRQRLGKGASGAVFAGTLQSGTDIAVKVLKLVDFRSEFEDEVRVLSRCRHPNVVTLFGWAKHEHRRFIVYEFLPGGDVSRKLKRAASQSGDPFLWRDRLRVAIETCQGVSYLHGCRPKVFHRDIKAANVLLTEHGTAKLADFGLACVASGNTVQSSRVTRPDGTPGYADPTYVQTLEVNESREVYSLGMFFLELLTNKPPAAYTQDLKGTNFLKYLIDEIDSVESALALIDPNAQIPRPLAELWIHLTFRCIYTEEYYRPTSAQVLQDLKSLLNNTTSASFQRDLCPRIATSQNRYASHSRAQRLHNVSSPWSLDIIDPGASHQSGSTQTKEFSSYQEDCFPASSSHFPHEAVEIKRAFTNQRRSIVIQLPSKEPPQRYHQDPTEHFQFKTFRPKLDGGRQSQATVPRTRFPAPFVPFSGPFHGPEEGDLSCDFVYLFRMVKAMSNDILLPIPSKLTSDDFILPGCTQLELSDSMQCMMPALAFHISQYLSSSSPAPNLPINLFGKPILFGRKRQDFRQRLKLSLPPELFTCVSRYHFSITAAVRIFPSEVRLAHSGPRVFSAAAVYNSFIIYFTFSCLSPNGAGINRDILELGKQTTLHSGDLVHMFDASLRQKLQHMHQTSLNAVSKDQLSVVLFQFLVDQCCMIQLKQKLVAQCLKQLEAFGPVEPPRRSKP